MFRGLRTFVRLMRASRTLRQAEKLEKRGRNADAAARYADVLRQLDSLGELPESLAGFSTLDPPRITLRLVACTSLAGLRWKAGDAEGGKLLAREVLDLCHRAQGIKEFDKWRKWAREFIGPEGPPN